MSKADRFFSISEAAQKLGVSISTLRRWEREGKISIGRTPGGKRLFREEDLELLSSPIKLEVHKVDEQRKTSWKFPKIPKWRLSVLTAILVVSILANFFLFAKTDYPKEAVLGIQDFVAPISQEVSPIFSPITRFISSIGNSVRLGIGTFILSLLPQVPGSTQEKRITVSAETIPDNLTLSSLSVSGNSELSTATIGTLAVTNNETIGGTLIVTGSTTLKNDLKVEKNITLTGVINSTRITDNKLIFGGDSPSIYAGTTNTGISLNANGTGAISIGNSSSGDIYLGGGSTSTVRCFITNASGNLTCSGDIQINGGDLTTGSTTFNLINTSATTLNIGGAATTLSVGASSGTTTVNNALTVTGAGTFSSTLGVTGAATLSSTLGVTGITSLNGAVNIGDATSDDIAVNGRFTTSLVPKTTGSVDLGSSTLKWNNVYANTINTAGTNLSGQAIFTYDPADTTIGESSVYINPTTAGTNEALLGLAIGGSERARIDTEGDIALGFATGTLTPNSNPLTIYNHGTTSVVTIDTAGAITTAGNFSQTGTTTFSTGTGAISLNGDVTIAAGKNLTLASGTGIYSQTFTGTTTDAFTITANSLISGNALDISSTSTAAATGDALVNLSVSGANGTATVTRYGVYSSVTSTGTTSTNVGVYGTASGATNNYAAIFEAGNVGIGTTSPADPLHIAANGGLFGPTSNGVHIGQDSNGTARIELTTNGGGPYIDFQNDIAGTDFDVRFILTGDDSLAINGGSLTFGTDNTYDIGASGATRPRSGYFGTSVTIPAGTAAAPSLVVSHSGLTTTGIFAGAANNFSIATAGTLNASFTPGLNVLGQDSTSGTFRTDIGGTGTGFAVCHDTQTGTDNSIIVDCTSAPGADFAEIYPLENGLELGDVVVTGTESVNTYEQENGQVVWSKVKGKISKLVKSTKGYQGNILGVVSDNYGDFTSVGYNIKSEDNPKPVALVGRIPVKISIENGAVNAGDFLTSSATKPGYSMKASKPGRTIGVALEGANADGKIMVFVNPSWYDPTIYIAENGDLSLKVDNIEAKKITLTSSSVNEQLTATSSAKIDNTSTSSATLEPSILSRLDSLEKLVLGSSTSSSSATFDNLTVLKKLLTVDLGITGTLTSGLLNIKGLDSTVASGSATINTLSNDLYLQNLGVGGINILNGKVLIDKSGNLKLDGTVLSVKGPSVGSAVLTSGTTALEISTTAATTSSRIFVTANNKTGKQPLLVTNKADGKFTVSIEDPYTQDINFDWWVIESK